MYMHTAGEGEIPLKVMGSLICREDIRASFIHVFGHLKANGMVATARLKVSGDCSIAKACHAESIENLGSLRLHSLQARHVHSSGYLSAAGPMRVATFAAKGAVKLQSLEAADSIEIVLGNTSTAERLTSSGWVHIRRSFPKLGFHMGSFRRLACGLIQGASLRLEYTSARLVCGTDIAVGPGCDIGEIRYSHSLTVAPGSKVGRSFHCNDAGDTGGCP
ncbi:hypothetical protein [Paenibacillus tengchongensis]|uniref:hypothetical protein n=1 Tax=Paenibacillus tengchongensis TaxID=2608684 RepID=UPI00124F431F|nr:hypothetical protein [Paenibacillus tengchongensis]